MSFNARVKKWRKKLPTHSNKAASHLNISIRIHDNPNLNSERKKRLLISFMMHFNVLSSFIISVREVKINADFS